MNIDTGGAILILVLVAIAFCSGLIVGLRHGSWALGWNEGHETGWNNGWDEAQDSARGEYEPIIEKLISHASCMQPRYKAEEDRIECAQDVYKARVFLHGDGGEEGEGEPRGNGNGPM